MKTTTADDRSCFSKSSATSQQIHQERWNKSQSMIKSRNSLFFSTALVTYLLTIQNTSYISSQAEQTPHLFHPAHVVAWPSLCHCGVCAVVAGAADGADVSVNALHVCRDAAFLNPPTHCSQTDSLPPALCWSQAPCKGKLSLTSFRRKLVYWCWSSKHHILRERLKQTQSDSLQTCIFENLLTRFTEW